MSKNNNTSITKNKYTFSVFHLIFILIVGYLIITGISLFQHKRVALVDVSDSYLNSSQSFTALAIRDEKIIKAKRSGYVNYFVGDNSKVGSLSNIMAIDGSGDLYNKIKNTEQKWDTKDLLNIRNYISNYSDSDGSAYDQVKKLSQSVDALKNNISSFNKWESIKEMVNSYGNIDINYYKPSRDGYIVYSTDGYENKKISNLTNSSFNHKKYKQNNFTGNMRVQRGDPVYKLVVSNNWSLVVPIDSSKFDFFKDFLGDKSSKAVNIRFIDDNIIESGRLSLGRSKSDYLLIINLKNGISRYLNQRFIRIDLIMNTIKGYKIPISSITQKLFYRVNKKFITSGGSQGSAKGILVEKSGKDSNPVFIELDYIKKIDNKYYVSAQDIGKGTVIVNPKAYQSKKLLEDGVFVKGVFIANRGFAYFTPVDIIDENSRFAIVDKNTTRLMEYDKIVLDASAIKDDEILIQGSR